MNPFNLYRSNTKREQLAVPERGRSLGVSNNPHPKPVQPSKPKSQTVKPKTEPAPVVAPFPAPPTPPSQPKPETKKIANKQDSAKDLAEQRKYFGFDDIPTDEDQDMSNVRFRDIFKAWGKQSVKDSELEKKFKNGKTRIGRLKKISNDVKWALQADLDEPVAPHVEPPKQPQSPAATPIVSTRPQFADQMTGMPATGADKTIDINISFGNLPKFVRPKLPSKTVIKARTRKLLKNRKVVALAGVAIVIGAAGTGIYALNKNNHSNQTASDTPTYKTITPADKTAGAVTWKRVSPPNSDAVYAYSDKIDNVVIMVSQQPLPDAFKDDPDGKTGELAKGFGATTKIDADGTKVYLGASSEGPQSVIFAKNNLLILMKSQSKISNDGWTNYIKTLN